MTHPITPPPELLDKWLAGDGTYEDDMRQAAQWGADQELEACCRWLPKLPPWSANDLRKHRRPKPPSLKEQALEALRQVGNCEEIDNVTFETIRRALEALPND